MASKITKITCGILLIALLAGIFAGCQQQPVQLPETTGSAFTAPPSSTATEPVTTPPATEPEPSIPAPVPLPPGTAYTVQTGTIQKPAAMLASPPKLSAKEYFIYDTKIEAFLYISCDESTALYPASTTKLFTTWVALQYLNPADTITVGSELNYVAADASCAGFRRGDRVSVEALIYGALLPSGCDASYILAAAAGRIILNDREATAKAAISAFMDECNRLAAELGMENTHFVTPDGYHRAGHKISMLAFPIIAKLCLENTLISEVVSTDEAAVTCRSQNGNVRTLNFKNTNKTLRPESEYYNALSVGLKTGFTGNAGYCLLTAYQVEGCYIIVGIFGCSSANQRFADANKLLNTYLPYL